MRRLGVLLALIGAVVLAHAGTAGAAVPWCGNDQLSNDRPDVLAGPKVHVIYAIPADGADRFAESASAIVTDLSAVNDWWRREDPAHAPRWDLFSFPGCGGGVAALDLSFVRLPRGADAYFLEANRLSALSADMGRGFGELHKKYLVYYDGPVADEDVCGSGFQTPQSGGRFGYGGIYLQSHPGTPGCGDIGVAGYRARTAAHELLHMFGAVTGGAPHPCPDDPAHACDSSTDVMKPRGPSSSLFDYVIDFGRDDYYAHSGSWWDVQDSAWLSGPAPDRILTVELVNAHSGTRVSSVDDWMDCPRICSFAWPDGETVSLEDHATGNDSFRRWEGSCTGKGGCELTMDGDKTVRVVFGPATVRLAIRLVGRGRVISSIPATCSRSCRREVYASGSVKLRAVPATGWRFARWVGCRPTGKLTCRVKMTGNRAVSVVFKR